MIVLKVVLAMATLVIFIYWQIREKKTGVEQNKSGHPRIVQILVRGLLPVAGAVIIAQLLGWQILPIDSPIVSGEVPLIIGSIFYGLGFGLSIWARVAIGDNWVHAADYQILPGQQLVMTGPYCYIRHPIYTGLLLIFLGAELVISSWLVLLVIPLVGFIFWQAIKEERLLSSAYGSAYREYQRQTGMLWPRIARL